MLHNRYTDQLYSHRGGCEWRTDYINERDRVALYQKLVLRRSDFKHPSQLDSSLLVERTDENLSTSLPQARENDKTLPYS